MRIYVTLLNHPAKYDYESAEFELSSNDTFDDLIKLVRNKFTHLEKNEVLFEFMRRLNPINKLLLLNHQTWDRVYLVRPNGDVCAEITANAYTFTHMTDIYKRTRARMAGA